MTPLLSRLGRLVLAAGALAAAPLLAQNFPPWRAGFPYTIAVGTATNVTNQPAVADLGLTAGWKSIVFGTFTGQLYVVNYNGTTPSVASGFPKQLLARIDSAPAIGDVDGDGVPDIVVGYGTNVAGGPNTPGGVCAFRRNGAQIWCRALDGSARGFPNAVVGAPAIGDVDGDGLNEVAFGAFTGYIYVVNGATGANKPGFPFDVQDTIWSSAALFDLDGDGRKDVIIGVDSHDDPGRIPPTVKGGYVHALKFGGTEIPGFPFHTNDIVMSSPAVGDIDGDGKPEIVFGTGTYYQGINGVGDHRVYALKCDGTLAAHWPVSVEGEVSTAPALADLTGDGVPEVVVTDGPQSPSTTYHVYAFSGATGTQLWKTVPKDFNNNTLSAGNPVVADVLGTGNLEVLVPSNSEIVVLSNTGAQLSCNAQFSCIPSGPYSFYTDTSLGNAVAVSLKTSPTAADPIDVLALSATPFGSQTSIKISVWNPKTNPSPSSWPMFRQDVTRQGVVPGTPSCITATGPLAFHTVTPCRAADTRNANGTYGGPAIPGGGGRSFPLNGRCGIPSTAVAVSLNATAVNVSQPGYFTLFPGGGSAPLASTVNFRAGRIRANNAVVGVSSDGSATLNVVNGSVAPADLILDVNGYFQ